MIGTTTEKKQQYFHLSPIEDQEIKRFVPRVPTSRSAEENGTIGRVCVAPTLEGCVLAHPNLIYRMVHYLSLEYACPYQHMGFYHQLLEKGETGVLLRVYHLEMDPNELYTSEHLVSQSYVPDALTTGEQWIMSECEPSETSYLLIKSIIQNEDTKEFSMDYTIYDSLEECGAFVPYDEFYFLLMNEKTSVDVSHKKFSYEESIEIMQQIEDAKTVRSQDNEFLV